MKYRLFDFSGGDGELLTRGGLERVDDHAGAIAQVLDELRAGDWIASEADLAAVGLPDQLHPSELSTLLQNLIDPKRFMVCPGNLETDTQYSMHIVIDAYVSFALGALLRRAAAEGPRSLRSGWGRSGGAIAGRVPALAAAATPPRHAAGAARRHRAGAGLLGPPQRHQQRWP